MNKSAMDTPVHHDGRNHSFLWAYVWSEIGRSGHMCLFTLFFLCDGVNLHSSG